MQSLHDNGKENAAHSKCIEEERISFSINTKIFTSHRFSLAKYRIELQCWLDEAIVMDSRDEDGIFLLDNTLIAVTAAAATTTIDDGNCTILS